MANDLEKLARGAGRREQIEEDTAARRKAVADFAKRKAAALKQKSIEAAQDALEFRQNKLRPGAGPVTTGAAPPSKELWEPVPKQRGYGVLNIGSGSFGLHNDGGFNLSSPRGFGLDTSRAPGLSERREWPPNSATTKKKGGMANFFGRS